MGGEGGGRVGEMRSLSWPIDPGQYTRECNTIESVGVLVACGGSIPPAPLQDDGVRMVPEAFSAPAQYPTRKGVG